MSCASFVCTFSNVFYYFFSYNISDYLNLPTIGSRQIPEEKVHILEVCVPECNFPGTRLNPGNFPSLAFGNHLFPVPTQSRHSGLVASWSRFRSGNIWEFLNASRMKINKFDFNIFYIPSTGQIQSFSLVIWLRIFGHPVFIYLVVQFRSNGPTL